MEEYSLTYGTNKCRERNVADIKVGPSTIGSLSNHVLLGTVSGRGRKKVGINFSEILAFTRAKHNSVARK